MFWEFARKSRHISVCRVTHADAFPRPIGSLPASHIMSNSLDPTQRKAKAYRVHAVTHSPGRRAVVEYVAEVGLAQRARYRGPPNSEHRIGRLDNVLLCHRLGKARPASAGIKLRLRIEEGRSAADAAIDAVAFEVPISAGERKFRIGASGHLE